MGGKKKKSSGGVVKKESKYKIPKTFNCPLCDGKSCLMVKMNRKDLVAHIRCRICNKPNPPFEVAFCRLHKPVDVFYMYYEHVWQRDQAILEKKGIMVKAKPVGGSGGLPESKRTSMNLATTAAPSAAVLSGVTQEVIHGNEPTAEDDEVAALAEQEVAFDE